MNRNNPEEDISCNNRSINRIRLSRWMTKSNCFYSPESLNFVYFSLLIFETPVAYLCHFVNVGPTFPDIIFFSRDDFSRRTFGKTEKRKRGTKRAPWKSKPEVFASNRRLPNKRRSATSIAGELIITRERKKRDEFLETYSGL